MKKKILPYDSECFISSLSDKTLKEYNAFWDLDNSGDLKRFNLSSYVNKDIIDYCNSRNIIVKEKKILEFGSRLGSSFLSWLSMDCKKIVAIDINEKALNLSKKIFCDLGHKNIEYRVNNLNENLPINEEEFDIVSCNAVIEHIHPAQRPKLINELSKATKVGGYFFVSDTPNRLWLKEGHTTDIWFLNYLPFKMKCLIGSISKEWKGKLSSKDYDSWIKQGIEGVTYKEIHSNLFKGNWDNTHDILHNKGSIKAVVGSTKNPTKLLMKQTFVVFAHVVNKFYCQPKGYPSAAFSPTLNVAFLRVK